MGQRRISTILIGTFAALALLLASLGIYGVMSYTVAQRTREIGVRVALGATRRDVLRLIVGQGARIAGIGTVIGLVGATVMARLLRSQLFGVGPSDPATLVSIVAILALSVLDRQRDPGAARGGDPSHRGAAGGMSAPRSAPRCAPADHLDREQHPAAVLLARTRRAA